MTLYLTDPGLVQKTGTRSLLREGYYERQLENVAGKTCDGEYHHIVTRLHRRRDGFSFRTGSTVCTRCGRKFSQLP